MSLALVLNVGHDPVLLNTRASVLRAAGYLVESASTLQQTIRQFRSGDFDVVVLCHSVDLEERTRLISLIRASGSLIPVISVAAFADGQYQGPSSWITIESNPKKLLRGIEKVLDRAAQPPDARRAQTVGGDGDGAARHTILCIDDDPDLLAMRRKLLESAGYRVLTAQSGPEGIRIFATGSTDAVILDYAMPLMNGGAVAVAMRRIDKNIGLILHSGCLEIPDVESALFDRVIPKGVSPNVLISAIQQLLFDVDQKRDRPEHSAKKTPEFHSGASRAGSARRNQTVL